jgi:hypothetical protein
VPSHDRAVAFTRLQTLPHPLQLKTPLNEVSQPSVSGGVPLLQSPKPTLHVYEQVVPLHVGAEALFGVQTLPQPAQLLVVVVGVSQPSVSGGVALLQSA